MCQSFSFNKVPGLRYAALLKKESLGQVFSCKFCEISKSTFFTEHLPVTTSVFLTQLIILFASCILN